MKEEVKRSSSSSTIAKQQQLYIKCVSIHEYSQLSQLKDYFSYDKQPIILIARITPIILKNPEEGMKLVNELYLAATKNNNSLLESVYSIIKNRKSTKVTTKYLEKEIGSKYKVHQAVTRLIKEGKIKRIRAFGRERIEYFYEDIYKNRK